MFITTRYLSYPEPEESTRSLPAPFFKINFNTVRPSILTSFKWSLSLRLPHQNQLCTPILTHTCHTAICSTHFILLDFIIRMTFGRGTNHGTLHFAITQFSKCLLTHFLYSTTPPPKKKSSAFHSRMPLRYVPPSVRQTNT